MKGTSFIDFKGGYQLTLYASYSVRLCSKLHRHQESAPKLIEVKGSLSVKETQECSVEGGSQQLAFNSLATATQVPVLFLNDFKVSLLSTVPEPSLYISKSQGNMLVTKLTMKSTQYNHKS